MVTSRTGAALQDVLDTVRETLKNEPRANAVLARGIDAYHPYPGFKRRFGLKARAIARYPMYRLPQRPLLALLPPHADCLDRASREAMEKALKDAGLTIKEIDEVIRDYWDLGVRHIVALRGDPPEPGRAASKSGLRMRMRRR